MIRKDVVWTLADNIVSTRYEALPPETVETTKKSILDTLGVIAAASGISPECRLLIDLIKDAGGKEESTIIGFGGRVPAWMAAFANGAMGHWLDYDDLYYEALVHPSCPVVSAGLATAERQSGVSGKEFITAVALGSDLICRMGLAVNWKMDWNLTTVLGAFGTAAASGKLLKLNEAGIVSAIGIVLCEAGGTHEMRYSVGNHLGGMRDGYPAKDGVLSALMAKQGIIGPENSLEGRAGLFNVHFGGDFKKEVLIADLGEKFIGTHVAIKAWPTCGTSHVYIDATLRIVTKHDIQPRDIKAITLYVGDFAMLHCQPVEDRRRPRTTSDAKYSIPFSVAVAAVKRRVAIEDLTPEGIREPAVLELAQRVNPRRDVRFNAEKGEPPGMVEITIKDGSSYSQRLDFGYGHPKNPIRNADVIKKFRDCLSYSARTVSEDNCEKIIETVMNLEKTADVGLLARLFH